MPDVNVNRFETQYRLPGWALSEHRRLDRMRTSVLDKAFAHAFARSGFPPDGELCIRNLTAPVCLRLNRSNESIALNWSLAIAEEIADALRLGSADVIFYHSRRQALLDFAASIARGDLRRVWVWRQLGFWRSNDVATGATAILELVNSLCAESALLVPTLRALAEIGLLDLIAHRLSEGHWESLAWAAGQELGAGLLNETNATPSPRAVRNALRVLKKSQLIRTITSSPTGGDPGAASCRAMALLAALEVEPILLASVTAPAMIGIIAEAVRSQRIEVTHSSCEQQSERRQLKHNSSETISSEVKSGRTESADHVASLRTKPADSDQSTDFASTPASVTDAKNVAAATAAASSVAIEEKQIASGEVLDVLDGQIEPDQKDTKPIDVRRRALTRYGGLLFLLTLIEELGLPEEILNHAVLSARPFTWVIHQFALTLAPLPPNDPAALAFAGLPPQATSPLEEEGVPVETETTAVKMFVARIIDQLRVALDRPDESDQTLLEFVCGRRAEIVADPGWLEARFSIDDVSSEIRRAGWDLDPGYLPWLGVVVKFVYE